ncbi:hypothetical protein H7X68_03940 [Candidatus Saccharibacteria bacterium]|nr:hypothetical protein [Candidatus Saccharibacteria bacterium]
MIPVVGWRSLLVGDVFDIVSDGYKGTGYVFVSWITPGEVAVVQDSSNNSTRTIILSTTYLEQIVLSRIPAQTIVFQGVRGVVRWEDTLNDLSAGLSDAESIEQALARCR